ncbi:MAG: hypothetical protein ACI4NJ_05040 [Cellvibrio sp.]
MQVTVALSSLFPSHWQLQDVFCMRLHDVLIVENAKQSHIHSNHEHHNHHDYQHDHALDLSALNKPQSHDHAHSHDHGQCHFCSLYQQTSATEFAFPENFIHLFSEPILQYLSKIISAPSFFLPHKQAPPIV